MSDPAQQDVTCDAQNGEALTEHVGLADTGPRSLPFVVMGHSGFHDTSERIDEILDDAWGQAPDR